MSNILNNNYKPILALFCWKWGTISAHFLKLIIRHSKVNRLWLNVICQVINLKSNVWNASLSSRALLTKLETCFSGQTHTLPQLMCCKVNSGYINSLANPHTSHGGTAGRFICPKEEWAVRFCCWCWTAWPGDLWLTFQQVLRMSLNWGKMPRSDFPLTVSFPLFLFPASFLLPFPPLWFYPVCNEFDVMSGRILHKFISHHHKLAECLCRS